MSCGVGRQYTGSVRKVTNCQVGVFASCVSRHGHGFIDRTLYLPKAWTDEPARLARAHAPDGIGSAIALSMTGQATGANVPFRRVAADCVYGVAAMGKTRQAGKGCVPGVGSERRSLDEAGRGPLPEPPGTCRRTRDGVCRRATAGGAKASMFTVKAVWGKKSGAFPGLFTSYP